MSGKFAGAKWQIRLRLLHFHSQVRIGDFSAADHGKEANALCGITTKEQRASSQNVMLECPCGGLYGRIAVVRRVDDPGLEQIHWDLNEFFLNSKAIS